MHSTSLCGCTWFIQVVPIMIDIEGISTAIAHSAVINSYVCVFHIFLLYLWNIFLEEEYLNQIINAYGSLQDINCQIPTNNI